MELKTLRDDYDFPSGAVHAMADVFADHDSDAKTADAGLALLQRCGDVCDEYDIEDDDARKALAIQGFWHEQKRQRVPFVKRFHESIDRPEVVI